MSSLDDFSRIIDEHIAAEEVLIAPDQLSANMAALGDRRASFDSFAALIVHQICEPRLRVVAGKFANAGPVRVNAGLRCSCDFGYSDRFPAHTSAALTVGHDACIENVEVLYEVNIIPVFLKYDRFDKLSFRVGELAPSIVIQWVEARLITFIKTYLSVAAADKVQASAVAIDPVCGMRLCRQPGTAHTEFRGHPYFFCSDECRAAFEHDPEAYVWFKVI